VISNFPILLEQTIPNNNEARKTMVDGKFGLLGVAAVIIFAVAVTPAVLNVVSSSSGFSEQISTTTEFNLGTLENLSSNNDQLALQNGERDGRYTSQSFLISGKLEEATANAEIYKSTGIDFVVQVSGDSSFNTVQDSQSFSLNDGSNNLDLNVDGKYARVVANFSRGSQLTEISIDTENEWDQGTLNNLVSTGGILSLDGNSENGDYTSQTFDVSDGIPDNGTITPTVFNNSVSDLNLTVETSDDGFSSVKQSQTYELDNSSTDFDLTSFSSASDLRTKLDYENTYVAETFSVDTNTQWNSGTLENLTVASGQIKLAGTNITGTYKSPAYSNADGYLLHWLTMDYSAQNNDGSASVEVQSDSTNSFNSPDSYSFNVSSGTNTENLNLDPDGYARVVITLER